MQALPGFYHPTTLLLLDDDKAFLNSLQLALAPYYRSLAFTSAKAIEQAIRDHPFINEQPGGTINDHEVSRGMNPAPLYQCAFLPHRFHSTIILILDYDMPQHHGLLVAQQLKLSTSLKIIMLTGEADQATAVRAFNRGHIDRFITKGAVDYFENLLTYIQELHQDYFVDKAQRLLLSLDTTMNPLEQPEFIELFHEICQSHDIIEYYLLDDSYSFLLLNAMGAASWLLVRTEEDRQMYYELAQEEGSAAVLQSLQHRQQIACFPTLDSHTASVDQWRFYPAQPLPNQPIDYCLLTDEAAYPVTIDRIRSYAEFLQQRSDNNPL